MALSQVSLREAAPSPTQLCRVKWELPCPKWRAGSSRPTRVIPPNPQERNGFVWGGDDRPVSRAETQLNRES